MRTFIPHRRHDSAPPLRSSRSQGYRMELRLGIANLGVQGIASVDDKATLAP